MSRKIDRYDFIWESIQKHGYKYDYRKVNYITDKTKVCIICPIHGEFWQPPKQHKKGNNCPKCSGKYHYTTEEWIEKAKEARGNRYNYSKVNYIRNDSPVCIICSEHGEFWQTPSNHLNGANCPKCVLKQQSINQTKTTEEWIKEVKTVHGDKYDYSKVEYIHNQKPVCLICPIHGEFWIRPDNHRHGAECYKCSVENLKKDRYEFIWNAIQIHGYRYDYRKVNYIRCDSPVCIICSEHGEFWQTPVNHIKGCNCQSCAVNYGNNKSISECEIFDFIMENYDGNIIQSNRKIIHPYELDIYLPELNLAFEFDGLYWHNEINKPNNYHLNKTLQCEEKGIKLIHIFEDEWIYKRKIVESKILKLINTNVNIIDVNVCNIQEVNETDCCKFLLKNNLNENFNYSINIGLYNNNILYSIMLFECLKNNIYKLTTYSEDLFVTIPNGDKLLFNYFIEKYKPNEIIGESDIRWDNNEFYKNLGFEFLYDLPPNFFYVLNGKRLNHMPSNIKQTIHKIYDCGVKIFKYKKL